MSRGAPEVETYRAYFFFLVAFFFAIRVTSFRPARTAVIARAFCAGC